MDIHRWTFYYFLIGLALVFVFIALSPKDSAIALREAVDLRMLGRFFGRSKSKTQFVGKLGFTASLFFSILLLLFGVFAGNGGLVGLSYLCLMVLLFGTSALRLLRNFSLQHLFWLVTANAIAIAIFYNMLGRDRAGLTGILAVIIGSGTFFLCWSIVAHFGRPSLRSKRKVKPFSLPEPTSARDSSNSTLTENESAEEESLE
ncbi:MAG: hypothetical protein AAF483_25740 [Planctomycetota bacterium]